jgi:type I restriction enzyme S subunit
MTLETFFEKFDLFADAPGAVGKMRELVLNFAVTGRLSEPSSSDAPVGDLIAALSAAKKQRLNKGRRPASAEGAAQVEVDRPVVVPDHWAWVPLHEIGGLSGGMTPSKAKSIFWDGDINWFSSKDIKPDELTDSQLKITREGVLTTGLQLYSPGSLAMVTRSGILKHTFPVSILRVEGTVNQDLKVLSPFVSGLERYLQIMLRGLNGYIITSLVKTGMTVQSLKFEEFSLQPFPLPPLAEQKRIVAKVDELMALCDRIEAQQRERETRHAALARASLARFADSPTPANLDFLFHKSYTIPPADLRKSILTLAVQGKLVPQDPEDEPALALLQQIATHKAALAKNGKLRGSTTVKPMADDEAEFDLPSNWCWVRFGEIMVNRDGERIPVSKEERETKAKTYDYYGASGVIDKIDDYLFDKPLLLIGEDGANLINRSTPIAFIARGRYWVNNHAHVLDGISEDFLQFIELHINAINLEKYVTGSAQPKMNQAKMNSIPIALPPLAEQRRIVAKVDQLMALVDELETQIAASRATAAKLLSALVAELTASTT